MSTSKALTGGTGDVNPQYLTFSAVQSSLNETVVVESPLNLGPSATVKKGKALVFELLKIQSEWAGNFNDGLVNSVTIVFTTQESAQSINSPAAFYEFPIINRNILNDLTFTIIPKDVQDFTDGAGHGILIATPSIFMIFGSVGLDLVSACAAKVFYRWKEVSIEEYIGIVTQQSQLAN